MRDINSMSRGNALAPNRCNSVSCTAQLGLSDKGRAIKELIVCCSWDLEHLDLLNRPQVVINRPLRYYLYDPLQGFNSNSVGHSLTLPKISMKNTHENT